MAKRVKWRRPLVDDMEQVLAICLNQKRHDANGKRIAGHTFDEIAAMTPAERQRLKQTGWVGRLGKREGKR